MPADSPSRQLLFVCHPASASDELPCAKKILSHLARRAYRRSATSDDVDTLLAFYKRGRTAGTFDDGIRAALERVLVSPDFLFRIETDPDGAAPGSVYRVSDVELASRLSFFLWSSIPDDTLLDLAISGKLHEPAILDQQVSRMFADPRTRASLVNNFFSDWLQIRNVWLLNPDGTKFPWFDDNLRSAFVTETEMFLNAQLKEDHGVTDLLTSDETFLNEQLARHYGIPGVYGSHFRRVKLTDENRFGLLGKASILAVTSYSTRTSPTIRGKWLLENILAAPPPAPPPNVPSLESSNKDGKPLSVRQMLEMHRANPAVRELPRAHGPAGAEPGEFRCHRAVAYNRRRPSHRRFRRVAGRHQGGRAARIAAGPDGAENAICGSGNGETPDVRSGPRTAVLRCSDGPRDRPLRGGRWIPLVVADPEYCEERAIPDENRRASDSGQQ